jgi:hypothetical protein
MALCSLINRVLILLIVFVKFVSNSEFLAGIFIKQYIEDDAGQKERLQYFGLLKLLYHQRYSNTCFIKHIGIPTR